jgi:cytochrome c peroxidase
MRSLPLSRTVIACAMAATAAMAPFGIGLTADKDAGADPWLRPATVPAPANNPVTPERVELGKALFFDPRLSGSNFISCATCHNPALGWADAVRNSLGHGFKPMARNSPTIINTAYMPLQMWDGRRRTLEDQALLAIEGQAAMAMPLDQLVTKLKAIEGYASMFEKAYPGEGVSTATISKAIASFERTVVSGQSPFDQWRMGNQKAMSEAAKRGFALFTGKANCAACHQGFNFTDNGFHNIGVKSLSEKEDMGRFGQVKVAALKGAFKTPTLRDVELTAPYMHNGIYRTLEEVVEHYDRGGDTKENLSGNITPLGLSAQEKADLVAFMASLTGKQMAVTLPILPPTNVPGRPSPAPVAAAAPPAMPAPAAVPAPAAAAPAPAAAK